MKVVSVSDFHNLGRAVRAALLLLPLILAVLWCGRLTAGDIVRPGELWPDESGRHINAHGGGILAYGGRYYWYGEDKDARTNAALVGVSCYSSRNLKKWRRLSVALSVDTTDAASPIVRGCIIERPKVIYCAGTGQFVMWFHLELRDKGYRAAMAGVAVADRPEGPFRFLRASRVNAGRLPSGYTEEDVQMLDSLRYTMKLKWWTPEWRRGVEAGVYMRRDMDGGQMARDMQLFVDSDGKAYHIYASEENLTIQIAELTDDYTAHTGRYVRVAPGGQNEAPVLFRHGGYYWMITSGCTGWAPNAARLYRARSIMGPWEGNLYNPCCEGNDRRPVEKTFLGQGTYALPYGKGIIFMADEWRPNHPSDGRYLWLPISFDRDGGPQIKWRDSWSLKKLKAGKYNDYPE